MSKFAEGLPVQPQVIVAYGLIWLAGVSLCGEEGAAERLIWVCSPAAGPHV